VVSIPTGTVTFLFTDIENSTALNENYPDEMQSALVRHDEIMRMAIEGHGGYVFNTGGDAYCAAFARSMQALMAALAAQRMLYAEEWPENTPVLVRMGLHTGETNERNGNYFGSTVNRVARLMSAGHGGQVLLSDATYNLIRDPLRHREPGSDLLDMGEHRLRDLTYTERIFQLLVPDLPTSFPELRTHGRVTRSQADSEDPRPESELARYHIKRYLGGGGMAEVYLAHDEELDRNVAYKKLRRQYADDEMVVERFRREARSAASLSHPNIVNIYDRGKTRDGSYYIVMECLLGGTLKERIQRGGPLPTPEAAALALQVARALQAAHRRDLIHRDVKPQNILLTESGEAKVADFGIARATSMVTLTMEGSTPGTPHYISPEQALGEPASPRSDLYSLGIVLYEMLTGELPFDAETPHGIVMKHVREPVRPPRQVNPKTPEDVNAVVVKLLAKDPEERYADATSLIEHLERVGREDSLAAHGPRSERTVADDVPKTVEPGDGYLPVNRQDTEVEFGQVVEGLDQAGRGDRLGAASEGRAVVDEDPKTVRTEDRQRQERPDGGEPPTTVPGGGAGSRGSRRGGALLWGAGGVIVVVALALILFSQLGGPSSPALVPVPSLYDKTLAEAKLTAGGFKVEPTDEPVSGEFVLIQEPTPSERAESGSTIRVTLGTCDGQCAIVPDIEHRTFSEADRILESRDLNPGNVYWKPSDKVEEDRIINQWPPAGSRWPPVNPVRITVSTGPKE
jgi:eukaryotic-like serine/threonine-protein kinase